MSPCMLMTHRYIISVIIYLKVPYYMDDRSNSRATTVYGGPLLRYDAALMVFGTGILGTIGYVAFPTGVSTDVSRDLV